MNKENESNSINDLANEFLTACLPENASHYQRRHMKSAFYCGASAALKIATNISDLNLEQAMQELEDISTDINNHFSMLEMTLELENKINEEEEANEE